MRKKLVLICLGIFVAVFLLWPTTIQSVPCGPNANCEADSKTGFGGGARMVYSLVSGKDSAKGTGHYWLDDSTSFSPLTAFLGSLIIAGFVYTMGHTYKKKSRRAT